MPGSSFSGLFTRVASAASVAKSLRRSGRAWGEFHFMLYAKAVRMGLSDEGVWLAVQEGCSLCFQAANMLLCAKNAALRAI